ncbi:hypothetical protein B0H11DRAFT_2239488 [Mycena galericulata]|nr:hypothetical protein B0H11DRAFT_2239488 [Mycena galericulata]
MTFTGPGPGPDPPPSPPPVRNIPPNDRDTDIEYHPILDEGYDLPEGALPPPWDERAADDFSPFNSRAEFEFADFLYREEEMAGRRVDRFAIDAIQQGDIPWQSFSEYEVWDELDWAPKRVFKNGQRQYVDLFSGNWAWEQADKIAEDENTHGAMYVPSVLGSDMTTVSVGTGNTEFYPFYGGVGNLHHAMRRAHRDGLAVRHAITLVVLHSVNSADNSSIPPFTKFSRLSNRI